MNRDNPLHDSGYGYFRDYDNDYTDRKYIYWDIHNMFKHSVLSIDNSSNINFFSDVIEYHKICMRDKVIDSFLK